MPNKSDRLQIKTMKHITIYIVYFIHVKAVERIKVIYIHSNETYVKDVKLYSCKDVSHSKPYSLSCQSS